MTASAAPSPSAADRLAALQRIQPGRLRHALLLGQNHHLIHHLWVSVPWFRYRLVYEELESELRAEDIRVG
ncbi:MAG: fatty acid desaturase [Acidimicrobiales bacterium]|nr:fatty acid desaturase [Acidimicrobiales bacterium]